MSVKSASRLLDIIDLLSENFEGLTAKEISEKLAIPPSSTHQILNTMVNKGYLNWNEYKVYSIGPKLIQLGLKSSSYLDIHQIALPYLKEIRNLFQETVFLASLVGNEIVYLGKVQSRQTIATNVGIGEKRPIYCTGLGKAFLTFMPERERNILLNNMEFLKYTPNTVDSIYNLTEQIKSFSQKGYTVDNQEIEEGLYCLAVPVFDSENIIKYAISVSGPVTRMIPRKDKITDELLRVSKELSKITFSN